MASLGTATLVTRMDLSGLKAGFNQAESLSKQGLTKISADFTRIGRNMSLAVTAPLTAMGVGIVRMSGDFEKSMNRVSALSQATGAELDKLSGLARKLGADTQFSASEAADAMSFLAMAGFDTNQIYDSMADTLNLAAAAQLDMGSAADIVSNIMTGFGVATEDLGSAVDVLTKAFISSNTDLRMLGEGMKYVGPIASGLGVSIEETTAALGALSNAGIQGSMAGTSLRRILSTLASDADKLGISAYDAAGNMRPLADIIDELNERGMTTSATLEVFGDRGGPAMQALLSQGGQALRDFTGELENAGGTAERVATTQMAGLHGMMKELESAGEELMLALGDAGLTDAVKSLVTGITNLTRAINQAPEGVKRVTLVIGGLATAIGPLLLGLGAVVKILPVLATGLAVLSGPAGWIALATVGITGLAMALNGPRDSLSGSAQAAMDTMGRAQESLDTYRQKTLEAETAVWQLANAHTEDGLRAAVQEVARTMTEEGRESFIAYAEQAILSGEDVGQVAAQLVEYTRRMRQELLETELAAAESRLAMNRRWQQSASENIALYSGRISELQTRQSEINAELAKLGDAGYYDGSTLREELRLIEQELQELSGSRGLELALDRFNGLHGATTAAAEEVRAIRAEMAGLASDSETWLTGLEARRGGRQVPLPPSADIDDAANNVVTRVNEARDAVGEVETVTVRTAETAKDLFNAIAAGGYGLDQAVERLGGTLELELAAAEGKAELFRAALARAFDLEDLTADERAFLETELARWEARVDNLNNRLTASSLPGVNLNEMATIPDPLTLSTPGQVLAAEQAARQSIAAYEEETEARLDFLQRIDEREARIEENRLARIRATHEEHQAMMREWHAEQGRILQRQLDLRAGSVAAPRPDEGGLSGSVLEQTTIGLRQGLDDINLRATLFGDNLQLANERVRLHEQALLALASEYGATSSVLIPLQRDLEAARIALDRWSGAISRSADDAINGKVFMDWDSKGLRRPERPGTGLDAAGQKVSEDLDNAGVELATSIIGAGEQFVSIVESARSGDAGGVMSGIGGLAGGIMGAIGGAAGPWGAVVSAGMGLLGSLFSMGGNNSREREQAQERERQLARSTPAININATVNQTNNLNGGLMDPRTQVELDNRTRSIVAEVLDQIGIQQYLRPAGGTT